MKIHQIIRMRRFFANNMRQKAPAKTAYKIARFMQDTIADEEFYIRRLNDIAEAYGEKDESGNFVRIDGNIKIKCADAEIFKKEMDELFEVDSSAALLYLNIDELSTLDLTIEDMMIICDFIKEA